MINQFDVVQIIRTDNIKFMSAPPGMATTPHGNWSVVGFSGQEAIISKDGTIVRVPATDLRKIAEYTKDMVFEELKMVLKDDRINIIEYLSKDSGVPIDEVKRLLKEHGLPSLALNETHKAAIAERFKKVVEENYNG